MPKEKMATSKGTPTEISLLPLLSRIYADAGRKLWCHFGPHYSSIDDLLVFFIISSNMGIIKKAENYIPENEFTLLANCIFSGEITYNRLGNLSHLIEQFVTISDLIIKRKNWESEPVESKQHFSILSDTFKKISENKWQLIESKNSPTIEYLLKSAYSSTHIKKTFRGIHGIIKKYKNFSIEDLFTHILENTDCHLFNDSFDFSEILEVLQDRHQDEKILAEVFLNAINKAYIKTKTEGDNLNRNNSSIFIKIIASFLKTSHRFLSFNEIGLIMGKIDFQVQAQENYEIPNITAVLNKHIYKEILLLKGEIAPNELEEYINSYFYIYDFTLFEIISEKISEEIFHQFMMEFESSKLKDKIPFIPSPAMASMTLHDPYSLELFEKLKQEIEITHPNEENKSKKILFIYFVKYQNEILQLKKLTNSLSLNEIQKIVYFELSLQQILNGLFILHLNNECIDALSTHFKNNSKSMADFLNDCLNKLGTLAEEDIGFLIHKKTNSFFDYPKSFSNNEITKFLKSLILVAKEYQEIKKFIPNYLKNFIATDIYLVDPILKLVEKFNHGIRHAGYGKEFNFFSIGQNFETKIVNFIRLTGPVGADYLQKQIIGTSLLPLERFLNTLPEELDYTLIHDLTPYFKFHSKKIAILKDCLTVLGALNFFEKKPVTFYVSLIADKQPEEFLFSLIKLILDIIFKDFNPYKNITNQEELEKLFNSIPLEEFPGLALSAAKMKDNEYYFFFLHLLYNDLTKAENHIFLYDITQENPFGNKTALHNKNIRSKLSENNIDPTKALDSYRNPETFFELIIYSQGEAHPDNTLFNQLALLWSYLLKVDENLLKDFPDEKNFSKFRPKDISKIEKIKKSLTELKQKINTNSKSTHLAIVDVLFKNVELVNNINKNCQILITSNKEKFSDRFKEFSEHVNNHLKNFPLREYAPEEKSQKDKRINQNPRFIQVVQWDKSDPKTFFLGDAVGCCLSSTGTQFQAMVQRRLDDALFFFVAIDQTLKEPIALIWCYLAETQEDEIVLMANFFEVRAGIGSDDHTRLSILYGLLKFTEKYLKNNPDIKGFYMNQLEYGLNRYDLAPYEIKSIFLRDKLGGPLRTDLDNEELINSSAQFTQQHYYLDSLNKSVFHVFDPDVLSQQKPKGVLSVEEWIQDLVLEQAKSNKEITLDDTTLVMKKLITEHSFELLPFFEQPIETNIHLQLKIQAIIRQNMPDFPRKEKVESVVQVQCSFLPPPKPVPPQQNDSSNRKERFDFHAIL